MILRDQFNGIIKLFFVLMSLYCINAFANQQQRIHINFVTEHLPPFQMIENETVTGFATDIIMTALLQSSFTYDIKVYPWTRSYNMALNKSNTCIYSIARTAEREKLFKWVNPIAERNSSLIGLKKNNLKISSIEDAKEYRVAVIRDDVTHQLLLAHGFTEEKNLYVVNNTYSLLKLFTQRKGIDLIMLDAYTIKHRAKYNKIDPNIFEVVYKLNRKPLDYYLACSIQTSDSIVEKLRSILIRLKESGEINKIKKDWHYSLF